MSRQRWSDQLLEEEWIRISDIFDFPDDIGDTIDTLEFRSEEDRSARYSLQHEKMKEFLAKRTINPLKRQQNLMQRETKVNRFPLYNPSSHINTSCVSEQVIPSKIGNFNFSSGGSTRGLWLLHMG